MEPTLYVKRHCPWCTEAIDWLQQQKIKVNVVDVLEDASSYERLQQISRQSLTPTLELANGAILADFDISQLEYFLTKNPI